MEWLYKIIIIIRDWTWFAVFGTQYPYKLYKKNEIEDEKDYKLEKNKKNPIISPGMYEWESAATFNPAAILLDGRIHLVYRAMGTNGKSVLGYASSPDGIHFDERLPFPIFIAKEIFNYKNFHLPPKHLRKYSPNVFRSGGGWSGCEDPRLVIIENEIYLVYLAFEGWDSMRIAVSSLSKEHFLEHIWKWKAPKYISPQKQIHKNWVLFPEKINGKFAVLHNIHSEDNLHVRVDYINDFATFNPDETKFESPDPRAVNHKKCEWHIRARSVGPPPIKTEKGWLVLYHANDSEQPSQYKLGAMLLDLNNPSEILYRTQKSILEPNMWYENDWKPGVIYACGAVVMNNKLFVYYGGGDKYVAVATIALNTLLDKMINKEDISLTKKIITHK